MSTDPFSAPSPPKSFASPPLADTVVRPFTSQGGTFGSPRQSLAYPCAAQSNRPSTAQDSHSDLSHAKFGPYISASARTSYTRVDVDSLSTPAYPPLPPVPSLPGVQNPLSSATDGSPTATTPTPPSDAPTNGAQPLVTEPSIPQTPQVSLTFLLVSGLRKTQSFEPDTTVGRVKELVWSAWPGRDAEWQDERPPAPSYLRILYLGKILQDDDTLLHIGFPTLLPSASNATPTIVHLSIRPYGLPSDDPLLSKKKRLSVALSRRLSSGGGGRDAEREQDGDQGHAGCCNGCIIC